MAIVATLCYVALLFAWRLVLVIYLKSVKARPSKFFRFLELHDQLYCASGAIPDCIALRMDCICYDFNVCQPVNLHILQLRLLTYVNSIAINYQMWYMHSQHVYIPIFVSYYFHGDVFFPLSPFVPVNSFICLHSCCIGIRIYVCVFVVVFHDGESACLCV